MGRRGMATTTKYRLDTDQCPNNASKPLGQFTFKQDHNILF